MQNGDEALPSIILASRGLLVKMLIILEPHHIFDQSLLPLVCKTVTRLCRGEVRQVAVRCSLLFNHIVYFDQIVWSLQLSIIWNVHINGSCAELYLCPCCKHFKNSYRAHATSNQKTQTHFSLKKSNHMVYFDPIIHHSAGNYQFPLNSFLMALDTD